jgi:hypothetical protein
MYLDDRLAELLRYFGYWYLHLSFGLFFIHLFSWQYALLTIF